MEQSAIMFIVLAGAAFLLIAVLATHSNGSLNGIKAKTVGDGQHGTARWATKKELRRTYQYVPFRPAQWRKGASFGRGQDDDQSCRFAGFHFCRLAGDQKGGGGGD